MKFALAKALRLESVVLLLLLLALPRGVVPSGLPLVCAAIAWLSFVASWLVVSRTAQSLWQLAAAAALTGLAAIEPLAWLGVGLSLAAVGLGVSAAAARQRCRTSLGVGLLGPAVLYGGLFAVGVDERVALRLAFRSDSSAVELVARVLALILLVTLTIALLNGQELEAKRAQRAQYRLVAGSVACVLAFRLIWITSVATLRTDLMIWSEPPALVNLLKLHSREAFYGPMEWANSYSYSPGLELSQYALLRPFQLELSLRAHRTLGILWQLSSAAVLSRGLWPWLRTRLGAVLGGLAAPVLFAALACVTLSSLLAPHVHPDHLLLLCFCAAIALCLRAEAFGRRNSFALAFLPLAATLFKLTGAGIGVGLVLAVLFERRWSALYVLLVGGALALLTIPLCDATLGQFTRYAIELQASHPIEWWRLGQVPGSPPGLIFGVSLSVLGYASWTRRRALSVRVATRLAWLTCGLGLSSLVAFCKVGGRENSLLPFALGGTVMLLVLLGDSPDADAGAADIGCATTPAVIPLLVLFWAALSTSWPVAPLFGPARQAFVAGHEREVSWLREQLAQGRRPLSQGTAAWIDVGKRAAPRDRLSSASELDLGHWPALGSCEARLLNGTYDGMFLSAGALAYNPFLVRLRGSLERVYRVREPAQLHGAWPSGDGGYVILERR